MVWPSRTKSGRVSPVDLGCKSAPRRNKRVGSIEFENFLKNLGAKIEALIDSTPLGVSVPEPWCPSVDKKKAFLSNPASALGAVGEFVDDAIDSFHPFNLIMALGSGHTMLMNLREALANAVLSEETVSLNAKCGDNEGYVVVVDEAEVPGTTVPSEGSDEPFVDIGRKEERTKTKSRNAVSQFLLRRALNVIDILTLKANGIIVTSDDCSVECSLASLLSDGEFENFSEALSFATEGNNFDEDCSIMTEEAAEIEYEAEEHDAVEEEGDAEEDDTEDAPSDEEHDSYNDNDEYVITDNEEPALVDNEDFVDIRAEW